MTSAQTAAWLKMRTAKHAFLPYFREHYDPDEHLMVEPTAGDGSFFRIFPAGSLGFDLEPKFDGIEMADFLTISVESDRPIAVVGNPP